MHIWSWDLGASGQSERDRERERERVIFVVSPFFREVLVGGLD